MKKSIIFAAASAMFAFAGCTKDAIEPIGSNSELATISATTAPQEDETRTSLSNGDVLWTTGDQITLRLASDPSKFATYTLETGEGTKMGTFTGTPIDEGTKQSLYPQRAYSNNNNDAGSIEFILPETQTYKAGSFGEGASPMVARSDAEGENLAFKNLCGAIRLKLTGTATIKQITVTSAGELIVGTGSVDMSYTDGPHAVMIPIYSYPIVTLTDINETLDAATPKEFTIILPAGEYAAGMNINIETTDGKYMETFTTKSFTVTRSKVTPFTAFEVVAKVRINFSDKGFRTYLKKQGFLLINEGLENEDIDNEENKKKFKEITKFSFWESPSSFEGIEYFTELEVFWVDEVGGLTSLDVTKNTKLKDISISNTSITSLNVTKNTALTSFSCSGNRITSIDLTKNPNLEILNCMHNQLASLDLTKNTNLRQLYCYLNQLSHVDLTYNKNNIESNHLIIGEQSRADGELLYIIGHVSDNQTSDLDYSLGNSHASLTKDPMPETTHSPAKR